MEGSAVQLDWRVGNLQRQARRWTGGEIAAALDGLLAVDAAMKGEGPSANGRSG